MKKALGIIIGIALLSVLFYFILANGGLLQTQLLNTPGDRISYNLSQQYDVNIDPFVIDQLYYPDLELLKVEGGWVHISLLEDIIFTFEPGEGDFSFLEDFLIQSFIDSGGTVTEELYTNLQFFILEFYGINIDASVFQSTDLFYADAWFIPVYGGQFDYDRLIGYFTQQQPPLDDFTPVMILVTDAFDPSYVDPGTGGTGTDTGGMTGSAPTTFDTGILCGEYPDNGTVQIIEDVPTCVSDQGVMVGFATGTFIPYSGNYDTGITCGGSAGGSLSFEDGAGVCRDSAGNQVDEPCPCCDQCSWSGDGDTKVGKTDDGTVVVSGPGGLYFPGGPVIDGGGTGSGGDGTTGGDGTDGTNTTATTTTTGGAVGAGNLGGVGVAPPPTDDFYCPVDAEKDFDFGAAHYGVPTHVVDDGPHLVNGSESFEWLTWLGSGVDAGETGCCDDDIAIDQDGLLLGQSNRFNLFVETNHLLTPVPGIPVTSELGILIVVRYERKGLPHQMEYEFITAEFINESGIQDIGIPDPSTFENEGWLRLIYVNAHPELGDQDYDIRFGFDIDELQSWDGTHSGLMEIFYGFQLQDAFDPSIPPGEIEDYQYIVDCDGNVKFFPPNAFAWDYTSTGDKNCGDQIPPDVNYPTTNNLPVTVVCNFNNVQDIVCNPPSGGSTGGTTGGGTTGGGGTNNQSLIDQIEDLMTNYQLDPNRNTPETRLRIIHEFLRVTLPSL